MNIYYQTVIDGLREDLREHIRDRNRSGCLKPLLRNRVRRRIVSFRKWLLASTL